MYSRPFPLSNRLINRFRTMSFAESALKENPRSVDIGFIGTGTIASAIVTGFVTQSSTQVNRIAVSRRSEAKSRDLVEKFPNRVTVYDDNQSVVDDADIIFLTVLPQQTKEVLDALKFNHSRHVLVSLVSTSKIDELSTDSRLPIHSIYKMICLPAVATHDGVCLVTPPIASQTGGSGHGTLRNLLESLGGVVEAETEKEMSIMMVPSGLMGSLYGILKNNRDWLVRQGIPIEKASFLVGRQYHAMMLDAENRCAQPEAFEELIEEQTPGGLNEQSLSNLDQLGAFQMYDKVQDAMLARILGKTDGSLT